MSFKVRVEPEARADLVAAFDWYESQQEGLGLELLASAEATFSLLERFPEAYYEIYGDFRRAPIRRFPFALFYTIEEESVRVIGIFHYRRDPDGWKERISHFLKR
ncbi:type II toxin-antitoxin system RelE/ParE family toxin [bacterium]|nr:type II toxin-antitoxin system RelE/ParE family toxin [bacterium]